MGRYPTVSQLLALHALTGRKLSQQPRREMSEIRSPIVLSGWECEM